jgi:hypothetical protein
MRSQTLDKVRAVLTNRYTICSAAVIIFYFAINPQLTQDILPDTISYVSLAESIFTDSARMRPPVYPLLIRACKSLSILSGVSWTYLISLAQLAFLLVIANLVLNIFSTFVASKWVATCSSIFISIAPDLIRASLVLLPELMLAMLLVVVWKLMLNMASQKEFYESRFGYPLIIGVISGIASLCKPVWALGFIPLVLGVMVLSNQKILVAIRYAGLIACFHLILLISWQLFLIYNFNQFSISTVGATNLNRLSLRAGFTKDGEGTKVYEYLDSKGLLGKSQELKWHKYEEFTELKNNVPHAIIADPSFYRKAIRGNLTTFLKLQLSRWHIFYIHRPPCPDQKYFHHFPELFRYIYCGTYNIFFRPVLPALLLFSLLAGLYLRNTRKFTVVTALILLYFSAVITFFSYQDPHFARMRVGVEPLFLALSLLPAQVIIEQQFRGYRNRK